MSEVELKTFGHEHVLEERDLRFLEEREEALSFGRERKLGECFRLCLVVVKRFPENMYFPEMLIFGKGKCFHVFGCISKNFLENIFWCLEKKKENTNPEKHKPQPRKKSSTTTNPVRRPRRRSRSEITISPSSRDRDR